MEGNYDYYQLFLTPPLNKTVVKMLTAADSEPDHYPVLVLDINSNDVGTATDKAAYVALWNAAPSNAVKGKLTGGYGPFSFVLELKPGQSPPSKVTGNPIHVFGGVFSNTFDSKFN
ncbi:hypothetical protein [Chitinophaga sancti]|uniref:Uncharacterized protein n=1 Tax=Chitinophaga sancti TaxID=1004 RepID=A0A1K1LY58_9BACT|nr:hypothetical protein [Chitinophaga sancti]WQD64756.1 hypothetical protein U0033_10145 [Chitinophaga sancti]WQG89622.1 hypothetical protein SR876_32330 [Chitinophaga sancti]SFW15783.1 hypothetical protein SAMN05661012_00314 [Chitinophaga sancti]